MGYRPPLMVLWFIPLVLVGGTHPELSLLVLRPSRATTSCHVPEPLKPMEPKAGGYTQPELREMVDDIDVLGDLDLGELADIITDLLDMIDR